MLPAAVLLLRLFLEFPCLHEILELFLLRLPPERALAALVAVRLRRMEPVFLHLNVPAALLVPALEPPQERIETFAFFPLYFK